MQYRSTSHCKRSIARVVTDTPHETSIDNVKKLTIDKYKSEEALRDIETISLLQDRSIEVFLHNEVLPYELTSGRVFKGKMNCEISFRRYFYKPESMRRSIRENTSGYSQNGGTKELLREIAHGSNTTTP